MDALNGVVPGISISTKICQKRYFKLIAEFSTKMIRKDSLQNLNRHYSTFNVEPIFGNIADGITAKIS